MQPGNVIGASLKADVSGAGSAPLTVHIDLSEFLEENLYWQFVNKIVCSQLSGSCRGIAATPPAGALFSLGDESTW